MISEPGCRKKKSSAAAVPTCTKAAAPLPTSSEMALAIEERTFMGIPRGWLGVGITWWCKVVNQCDRPVTTSQCRTHVFAERFVHSVEKERSSRVIFFTFTRKTNMPGNQ